MYNCVNCTCLCLHTAQAMRTMDCNFCILLFTVLLLDITHWADVPVPGDIHHLASHPVAATFVHEHHTRGKLLKLHVMFSSYPMESWPVGHEESISQHFIADVCLLHQLISNLHVAA